MLIIILEFFSLRAENYKYEKTISIYQKLRIVLTLSNIVLMRLNKDVANFTHIIQQLMTKNINSGGTGPKSWKSNQEGHKTTNSMIIQNYCRVVNQHPTPVIVQVKNIQYNNPPTKPQPFYRHFSEEDLRKHTMQPPNNYFAESPYKADDQYFPEVSSPLYKNGKQIRSIQKNAKRNPIRYYQKQKVVPEKLEIRGNYGLKETSSTQSAQNLGISRPFAPIFVKTKYSKGNTPKPSQYFSQRLSTPRTNTLKRQNFRIISKLGQGKFGKVFLTKQIYTGFVLAMKIVQKKKIIKQNLLEQFIRELRIQSYLNHSNIISLYGFFSDQTHFYTLMQLGCDGQLYSLISNRRILTQEATSFIVKNLLQAISYIHANKVLHRDIKPENIVLIMGNVKICDFGWAVNKLHPDDLRNTFCGTPLYLSPEIIQGNRYDEKVDLWAIGILAFELYLGSSPFDINDQNDLYKIATENIKFPSGKQISQEFKQFIYAMLTKNPHERLTSRKLLQLDFITKYKDFETCQQLCK